MERRTSEFRWVDDESIPDKDASNWASSYPRDNGDDCVMLWNGDEPRRTHRNEDCSMNHHFLCRLRRKYQYRSVFISFHLHVKVTKR